MHWSGDDAGRIAGRIRHPGRFVMLLPRELDIDADHFRDVVLKHFDMSLGAGLSKLKGRIFRIGHLGHFNELMLMGTLAGVEMALDLGKIRCAR